MSGGSYDYAYHRVNDVADTVEVRLVEAERDPSSNALAERRWFVEHLRLVAKAMRDVELVDSSDYSPGDELEAIAKLRAHLRDI